MVDWVCDSATFAISSLHYVCSRLDVIHGLATAHSWNLRNEKTTFVIFKQFDSGKSVIVMFYCVLNESAIKRGGCQVGFVCASSHVVWMSLVI